MIRRGAAEFIGTFGLVFAGTGTIVVDTLSEGMIGHLGVALVFGLAVAAMVYSTGHVSGAHINPAVTLSFALVRHFPWKHVPIYSIAQLSGALAASACIFAMFGLVADLGATIPQGRASQSLALEVLLSFFLMFVIMAVATDVRAIGQAAALAIGATLALGAIFAGPVSGASMNPARSFAPATVSGNLADLWMYWAGPLLGLSLAAVRYGLLRGKGSANAQEERLENLGPGA